MSLPSSLKTNLKLPAIAAPMFLVSGPELVIATCNAGVIGSFPAVNARTAEDFAQWMKKIDDETGDDAAPYAVNFPLSRMKGGMLDGHLEICREYKTPIIITSVGNPASIVDEIHDWGGLVFHDVTTVHHAKKAAAAGVDGLILVCAGAGGHAGTATPFALVEQVRAFYDGIIILGGGISTGRAIRAAEVLGADLSYLGTRFIATQEAMAEDAYKEMIITEDTHNIVYTNAISGLPANFMRTSLEAADLDPNNLPEPHGPFRPNLPEDIIAWKTVWSAGQGVGLIHNSPSTADLVQQMTAEYQTACEMK